MKMKKTGKSRQPTRRLPPLPGGKEGLEPPLQVITALTGLINTGQVALLEQQAREAIRRWPDHFLGWKALGIRMLMQGRAAEALDPLTKSVKLAPQDAQAHHNLGSAFLGLERFAEAEACYRQALALNPVYPQAHSNLGVALLGLGRPEEAEVCYRHALQLKPDFAEAHNNLGNLRKDLGRREEAEASYRQALQFRPDFAEAHQNLGAILKDLGRLAEAAASYREALVVKPGYALAQAGLGDTLLKLGRAGEAIACFRQAIAADSGLVQAHDGLSHALSRVTPLWHVPMMNDRLRNDAYFAALRAAITPEMRVLEIGTGSGLLAMMAAKLGARQVTTCEAVPEIAATARAIVADNGFTPPVRVVAKISTALEIGVDLAEPADLLVSEILSSEFLGEGVLDSIEDAKRRLLQPGARIIPARGTIQFALFGGRDIAKNIRVDQVYGFDLSRFNALVSPRQYVSRNDLDIELLSDAASAFSFDFIATDRFPPGERRTIEVPVRKAGRCCGIIQWVRLEMDDTIVFENHPAIKNPASGWQHCVFVFPSPIDLLPDQVALISAAHNRTTPWFFFEGVK